MPMPADLVNGNARLAAIVTTVATQHTPTQPTEPLSVAQTGCSFTPAPQAPTGSCFAKFMGASALAGTSAGCLVAPTSGAAPRRSLACCQVRPLLDGSAAASTSPSQCQHPCWNPIPCGQRSAGGEHQPPATRIGFRVLLCIIGLKILFAPVLHTATRLTSRLRTRGTQRTSPERRRRLNLAHRSCRLRIRQIR